MGTVWHSDQHLFKDGIVCSLNQSLVAIGDDIAADGTGGLDLIDTDNTIGSHM